MKVLVAEDDPLVLHLLERLLAVEYEVVTARDGVAAWKILRRQDGPRLAVLDWQMPGMDGTASWAALAHGQASRSVESGH